MTRKALAYIKRRLPEVTTRVGAAITLLPAFVDMTTWQSVALFFVAVVLFGIPEDKALARIRKR